MKAFRKKVVLVLAGAALMATSCSSGGDESSVEAAQTTAAPETTITTTTTEPESTTTSVELDDTQMIAIEGELTFGEEAGTGTFDVTAGSDILGCESGTLAEYPSWDKVVYDMVCSSGMRSGTFISSFAPAGGPTTFRSDWDLVLATGEFGDVSGSGDWTGRLSDDGSSATFTMTGGVAFGEVAEPLSSFPRLAPPHLTECFDGRVGTDGLFEYATVDDEMLRLDLSTGEVTEHGPPPSECAWWLGDEEAGRRVAISLPEGPAALPEGKTKVWFGPFDGPWETEREFDEVTWLLSRSLTGNRLILLQPGSGSAFVLDATTGDPVGPTISGTVRRDNNGSSAVAVSRRLAFIAVGGADVESGQGRVFVLDAETGEEVFQVETARPVSKLVFDEAKAELVAGLATGELLTIDLATEAVVAEVRIERTADFDAVGIRPDGLLVVYTGFAVELVDRHTGPTGTMIKLRDPDGARIRPDGAVGSFAYGQHFEVYEIDS